MFKVLVVLCLFIFSAASEALTVAEHAEDTFVDAFDTTGLEVLAVGTAATLLAFSQDQAMHDAWAGHQRMSSSVSSVGNFWGSGYVEIAAAIVQLFVDRENGIVDAEGLASSSLVVGALKYSVGRQRPDTDTATSFPSGHTQFSFASATNIQASYGWKVGAPMYVMGVFTGLSRLADNAHWLSDVVAGATIGIIFGRAGFKHHLALQPLAIDDGGQGGGLLASWQF